MPIADAPEPDAAEPMADPRGAFDVRDDGLKLYDASAGSGAYLIESLNHLRSHLAQLTEDASARAADALRLLALMPDSDRAFRNAIAALNRTTGEESPSASGGAADMPDLAHSTSHLTAETSPEPQVLGDRTARGEWTHRNVPGGTERTDESTIYQRPGGATTQQKKAKK